MKLFLSSSSSVLLGLSALLVTTGNAKPIPFSYEVGDVITSMYDFAPYLDENGKLSTHLLLYPESCMEYMEKEFYPGLRDANTGRDHFFNRKIHPVSSFAEQEIFGTNGDTFSADDCNAVCIERGVDKSLIQHAMPHLYYKNDTPGKKIDFWYIDQCEAVYFGFMNYHDKVNPVNIYWVDPNTDQKILNQQLQYGEQKTQFIGTILGHKFIMEDSVTGEHLMDHTVEFEGIRSIGKYVPSEEEKQRKDSEVEGLVARTLQSEWARHHRVKRTFSALGFAKGRLPDDIFASMGAYYYNNAKWKSLEEWGGKGVFVNWWEVDVNFIQISWHLKRMWQQRLLELVEDWVDTKLEQTDMYGIRQYEPGARLLTHVDREATHAASLIVNIAQGNVTEPWRVEIHDHADRLHEVVMQPGDIVYYESARCLHGRNTPLKGGYYANLFTHYRPIGDPKWYLKENPPGTPEKLIDVGNCKLVGPKDAYSKNSVQCDDKRAGPHLSPTQFQATSAFDLYKWWETVAPEKEGAVKDEL